jgi:tetratricopeptide (TPR) repeat protein
LEDKRGIALALDSLGTVLLGQDDYDRAVGLLSESLELRREMGDKLGMANSLSNLAIVIVTYQQGDYGRAKVLCEESLALYRELKCEWGIATSLNNLGAVANQEGDHERAKPLFIQSLALFQELSDKAHIAICLEGLAGVACAQKELERAARLLGAAKASSEASNTPLPLYMRTEHECSVAALRTGLSESVFTTAWAEGEAMMIEEAVAYASKK